MKITIGPPLQITSEEFRVRFMADTDDGKHALCVKIPESLSPIERREKYADPIAGALVAADLGLVTGSGSTAQGDLVHCLIDLQVTDVAQGLEVVKRKLREIGAADGTVIECGGKTTPVWRDD